jgi:uncharacterized membrane protein YphA (DoxX/SURF4 family)
MSIARHLPTAARILLGLAFFVFGLNGFLHFIPQPADVPEKAAAFAGALMQTHYMFPLLKSFEVIAGALLLAGRFVPLALTLLAPILVNIVAFHLALEPSGSPIAIVLVLLEVYLAWSYRDVFRPMLAARAQPAGRPARAGEPSAAGSGARAGA